MTQQVERRGKTVSQRVKVKAKYRAGSDEVSLTFAGSPSFARGGQLVVNATAPNGITDTSGNYLAGGADGVAGTSAVFVILPDGQGFAG